MASQLRFPRRCPQWERRVLASGDSFRIVVSRAWTRRRVTRSSKKRVAARQRWECNDCRRLLDEEFQVDHIRPLFDGGTNDVVNLQALCPRCHGRKTRREWGEQRERRERRESDKRDDRERVCERYDAARERREMRERRESDKRADRERVCDRYNAERERADDRRANSRAADHSRDHSRERSRDRSRNRSRDRSRARPRKATRDRGMRSHA